jgi:hypothetical protein
VRVVSKLLGFFDRSNPPPFFSALDELLLRVYPCFSGLTLAPQMRHVSQELLEPCAMSELMSSSTLNPLASASSLTLQAVPSLTVSEHHPISGMNSLQQKTTYIFDRQSLGTTSMRSWTCPDKG